MKLASIIKNWKTSILGLIPLVAALLGALGVVEFTPEQAQEAVGNAFDGIIEMILAIVGLIALFSRDADKSSEDSGVK